MEEIVRTARAYEHGEYVPRHEPPEHVPEKMKKPRYVGMYRCVTCGRILFNSENCVSQHGARALFNDAFTEDAVILEKTYGSHGEEYTHVLCGGCRNDVGTLGEISFNSATDLEQGTAHRYYHVNLANVRLCKALIPRNYPVASALLVGLALAASYAVWLWGTGLVQTARMGGVDAHLTLWVGNDELKVSTVHLDRLRDGTASTSMEVGPLFVVLPSDGMVPSIRFANHPVDIVWLDGEFRVLGAERGRAADAAAVLTVPSGAVFAIIGKEGSLPEAAYGVGSAIVVPDKSQLF